MNTHIPTIETVIKNCTGRKGLRTNRPKCGFSAYVWRWARFHSGIDMTMPCTDIFYLYDYMEKYHNKMPKYNDPKREDWETLKREYEDIGQKYADQVCEHFGLNKNKAALRWGRALGYF